MKYGAQIEGLLGQMRQAGISDAAQRFMPSWWRPDTEQYPDAVAELKLRLARALGLNLSALLDHNTVEFQLPSKVRFKRAKSQAEAGKLNPFVAYAASLAKTVSAGLSESPVGRLPKNPMHVRRAIFQNHADLKWLSLEALLDFCWDIGVAVVHIENPPFQTKGFDGLSLISDGRPVIMLARAERYPAWQVFILAHELAHIALGHVGEDEIIVDEAVVEAKGANGVDEPEEDAADAYALSVLGGDAANDILDSRTFPALDLFIDAAMQRGAETKTDPGHVILRSAYVTQDWGPSRIALREIQKHKDKAHGGHYDARNEINKHALAILNLDELSESSRSVLVDALGAQPAPERAA